MCQLFLSSHRPTFSLFDYNIYNCFLSSVCRDQVDPFDEEFCDTNDSGQGVWSEISKRAAIELSRNVFSLASFKGELVSSH